MMHGFITTKLMTSLTFFITLLEVQLFYLLVFSIIVAFVIGGLPNDVMLLKVSPG